jgi:phospholipid-binding lipoprotein MlaA
MSFSAVTGALLLASAPAHANDVDVLEPSIAAVSAEKEEETHPSAASIGDTDTFAAVPPPSDPLATTDPIENPPALIAPLEAGEPISSVQEISEPSEESLAIETEEPENTNEDENIITVTGRTRTPGDPLQNINAESFAVTQAIDEAVIEPTANAYEKTVPEPVRNGLRNFANNLHEPSVFVNFLLQLKPGKAAETFGRFAINSTVGVAGLFDIAKRKPINLPRRKNGFADTLGCYGVKPGPFLFLPVIGPTTVRDLVGGSVDAFAIPLPLPNSVSRPLTQPPVALSRSVARELDKRIEFDEELTEIRKSDDPYVASRKYYLQKRQTQINGLCGPKTNDVPPQ